MAIGLAAIGVLQAVIGLSVNRLAVVLTVILLVVVDLRSDLACRDFASGHYALCDRTCVGWTIVVILMLSADAVVAGRRHPTSEFCPTSGFWVLVDDGDGRGAEAAAGAAKRIRLK